MQNIGRGYRSLFTLYVDLYFIAGAHLLHGCSPSGTKLVARSSSSRLVLSKPDKAVEAALTSQLNASVSRVKLNLQL